VIAFEINLNGESLGTAGNADLSVLSAIVNAVGKLGVQSRGARQMENDFHLELTVGGLTSRADSSKDEFSDWIKRPLNIGDTVTIRVVEIDVSESPTSSRTVRVESDQERYFKWAKDFYFANRDKFENS
jgi:hypothetical protein